MKIQTCSLSYEYKNYVYFVYNSDIGVIVSKSIEFLLMSRAKSETGWSYRHKHGINMLS